MMYDALIYCWWWLCEVLGYGIFVRQGLPAFGCSVYFLSFGLGNDQVRAVCIVTVSGSCSTAWINGLRYCQCQDVLFQRLEVAAIQDKAENSESRSRNRCYLQERFCELQIGYFGVRKLQFSSNEYFATNPR